MLQLIVNTADDDITVKRNTRFCFNIVNKDNNYINALYDKYNGEIVVSATIFRTVSNVISSIKSLIIETIKDIYSEYKKVYIRSIAGVRCTFNAFYLFTEGALKIYQSDKHELSVVRTHASKFALTTLFELQNKYIIKLEYYKIYALQVCLYQTLCNLLYRILQIDPPYGLTRNYIGTQTKYNLTAFKKSFDPQVIGTPNAVYIKPYFKNSSCSPAQLSINIRISGMPKNPHYYGIYLHQADQYTTINTDVVSTYKIYKQNTDITDPNNCDWRSPSTAEPFGNITVSSVIVKPRSSFSAVFSIAKNINVNGFTSLGALSGSGGKPAEFTVTIDFNVLYYEEDKLLHYTHEATVYMAQIFKGHALIGPNINGV